jgi:hypothetical protein
MMTCVSIDSLSKVDFDFARLDILSTAGEPVKENVFVTTGR